MEFLDLWKRVDVEGPDEAEQDKFSMLGVLRTLVRMRLHSPVVYCYGFSYFSREVIFLVKLKVCSVGCHSLFLPL